MIETEMATRFEACLDTNAKDTAAHTHNEPILDC